MLCLPVSITLLAASAANCHFVKSFDGLYCGLAAYNNNLAFKAIAAVCVARPLSVVLHSVGDKGSFEIASSQSSDICFTH